MRFDRIMVFAPSPELTVTVEDRGGAPDLHLQAGGQGDAAAQQRLRGARTANGDDIRLLAQRVELHRVEEGS